MYASSAATYGMAQHDLQRNAGAWLPFRETPAFERPLNVYGYSKLLFDQRMRRECWARVLKTPRWAKSAKPWRASGTSMCTVPREQHKGRMASVAFHQFNQFQAEGKVRLFADYGGYGPGQQMRDFVSVDDVVAVNLWFYDNPAHSGIFNLGTGRAQPFNDVAHAVVNASRALKGEPALTLAQTVAAGLIEYVPFPDALRGKYQCYTQADLAALRGVGCQHAFADVGTGVARYVNALAASAVIA